MTGRSLRAFALSSGLSALLIAAPAQARTIQVPWSDRPLDLRAIIVFFVVLLAALAVTHWASRRSRSAADFYASGGGIMGLQNGLAIAGDFMSAASFLGIAGLVFAVGFDGLIYSVGFLAGWPIVLFLVAERLRNLGKYTFADVASYRLRQVPVRCLSACGSLTVVAFYLIAQMVGAGKLIELLFGLPYEGAVGAVGILMIIYVMFGGMVATTSVQVVKAVLLLSGATFMAAAVLWLVRFDLDALFGRAIAAHPHGAGIVAPGGLVSDPVSAISLGVALMFGTAGLPHILMRFFTVSDARQARRSVVFATSFIGYFYILTFIIGFGAIVLVTNNPAFYDAAARLIGGGNMPALHLANATGGSLFLGFIAAVALATILAVVAGLTLAGAFAISHDLYASVLRRGQATRREELRISRFATVALGLVAIGLGLVFEDQNIAFMVGLAFAVAASANFPVLFLAMFWRRLTTRGAVYGGFLGLGTAIVLVILSPTVWVSVFGNAQAIFPYQYPALFSVAVAFLGIWVFSITDRSAAAAAEARAFEAQFLRSETGIGADGAVSY